MDEIKIQNYAREHLGTPFPLFRSLSTQEAEKIRTSVATRLGLNSSLPPLDLVRLVFERAEVIRNISAEDDNFNLKKVLESLGVKAQARVFINWYRFDNIDEISLNDLSNYLMTFGIQQLIL